MADSLPEIARIYNDSAWMICNKTTTLSPVAPLTLPVLFSSDYGYYQGDRVYRGYFDGQTATSVNITAQNGVAAGWTAWLNGALLGGSQGNASQTSTSALLSFTNATLFDTDNVITVVCAYTGHDETSTDAGVENPRGILGATLFTSNNSTTNFTTWKIQGNAAGNNNIDPVRGPLNEGGLHGERLGWHLPGFRPNGSEWSRSSPLTGLNSSGISSYITDFSLDIDSDLDVPIGIRLSAPNGTVARIMIFVNGYQYGKFVPHIGPQTVFALQPGIVNMRGDNRLAVSMWAQTDEGARLDAIELVSYGIYESGFGFDRDWSYLQPAWTEDRLQYA